MNINLQQLLQNLVLKGREIERASPPNEGPAPPTTIRLKPTTKHFLDSQAIALNISIQGLISNILDGVAAATSNLQASTIRTLRERFFYLFEAHKINFPGIISVMKERGFALSVLENQVRLADLMTKETIDFLGKTFFVKPEWIAASSDDVIEYNQQLHWYKNVAEVGRLLLDYAKADLNPHIYFIRRQHSNFDGASNGPDIHEGEEGFEPIGAVIRITKRTEDNTPFNVYRVCRFERWNWGNCRMEFKLLIAFCDKANQWIRSVGFELPEEDIESLCRGRVLPARIFSGGYIKTWTPSEYAGFNYVPTKETEEWDDVLKRWEAAPYLDKIIKDYRDAR
jgi:hypothetical protein